MAENNPLDLGERSIPVDLGERSAPQATEDSLSFVKEKHKHERWLKNYNLWVAIPYGVIVILAFGIDAYFKTTLHAELLSYITPIAMLLLGKGFSSKD